jgi:hypothetical protein
MICKSGSAGDADVGEKRVTGIILIEKVVEGAKMLSLVISSHLPCK